MQITEYSNQRILTTAQIAEAYEVNVHLIYRNFSNNKDRYTPGKHYFLLEGETLKQFKTNYPQNLPVVDPRTPSLYLWTEKGALMHAKSLNTDKAWQAYETLVDDYYRKIKQLVISEQQLAEARTMIKTLTDNPQKLPWGLSRAELALEEMTIPHIHRCIDDIKTWLAKPYLTEKQIQKLQDTLAELDKHVTATQATLHEDLAMNRHIDNLFFKMRAIAQLALPDPNNKY